MKFILFSFLIFTSTTFAIQKTFTLGNQTLEELKLKSYDKDKEAAAVVLYEAGNTYHDESNNTNRFNLITDYYHRVKIFKKAAFNKATIKFYFYKDEDILAIDGITYNLLEDGSVSKTRLEKGNYFVKDIGNNWKEISFTLPNVREGSVIEYKYSLRSSYFGLVRDWNFQSDIPKIRSDYVSSILGNWKYNVRLQGFLKLATDKPEIVKNCVNIPGYEVGSCMKRTYVMEHIPAFKRERYMSSEKNFKSRIIFDLMSRTTYVRKSNANSYTSAKESIKENVEKYTQTWKDADKTIRLNFLDNQVSEARFFKKQLPESILKEENITLKAKKIFSFIQNHFTWNSKYITYNKKLKKSFSTKVGSADIINLSLFNSLQAANIESYPVVLSTRENGFPTDLFPVVDDFNYVIVKAVINGKVFFLDATNKYLAFGQVRFSTLNGKVRVMDFDKGSFWEGISTSDSYSKNTRLNLTLNSDNEYVGQMTIVSKGYEASERREEFDAKTKEQYLEKIETQNPYLEIGDYKRLEKDNLEKPLKEIFEVTYFDDSQQYTNLRINPFFDERFTENPFKLRERNYPVDFGVPITYSYLLNLKIPENYKIVSVPEEARVVLPNKGGSFMLKAQKKEGEVNIFIRYVLGKAIYNGAEYEDLKGFFNQIIKSEKSFIEIKTK